MSTAHRWLLPMAILHFLVPVLPRLGIGEGMDVRAVQDGIPPELPLGLFFLIWLVIFSLYLVLAIRVWRRKDLVSPEANAALAAAGAGNVIWLLVSQFTDIVWLNMILLIPILVASWRAAYLLDNSPSDQMAQRVAGLMSGWLTAALAISIPDTTRWVLGWAVSDYMWVSLWLALVPAAFLTWVFVRHISRTWWFFAALGWGLLGVATNNWLRTEAHGLAIATVFMGLYVIWRRYRLKPMTQAI